MMRIHFIVIFLSVLMVTASFLSMSEMAYAQDQVPVETETQVQPEAQVQAETQVQPVEGQTAEGQPPVTQTVEGQPAEGQPVEPAAVPLIQDQVETPFPRSLFLTAEEIANMKQALVGLDAGAAQNAMVPAQRLIKLSGIVYNGENDWVVWLNGKRLTPRFLLPEILSIDVARNKVDLKWFDIGLNKVIKITLQPHQVYDVGTGILLTGGGVQ